MHQVLLKNKFNTKDDFPLWRVVFVVPGMGVN